MKIIEFKQEVGGKVSIVLSEIAAISEGHFNEGRATISLKSGETFEVTNTYKETLDLCWKYLIK